MCHTSCIIFGASNLLPGEVKNKSIIEVGSYDVNGSLRPIYEKWHPVEYIGVDIEMGPGVDLICDAEMLVANFGVNRFDIVFSTELLEHVKNWRKIISNLKIVCRSGGIILLTTRSKGFPFHGFPLDFWRFELEDLEEIFSDCHIEVLERDREAPGVFLRARKPKHFKEKDLSKIALFSMATEKRELEIDDHHYQNYIRNVQRMDNIQKDFEEIL